jgi:hypothetical protein
VFVLLMVYDVPVDNDVPVVTSSISSKMLLGVGFTRMCT